MISKGLLESYASFAPSNLVKMVASVNAHSRGLVLTTETTARRPSYAQRDRAIFHRCPYMFRKHRAFLSTPSEGLFLMISNDLNPLHREPTIDCRVETCHRFQCFDQRRKGVLEPGFRGWSLEVIHRHNHLDSCPQCVKVGLLQCIFYKNGVRNIRQTIRKGPTGIFSL